VAQNIVTADDVQVQTLEVEKEDEVEDNRPPIERFRKPPKKPLSVTDIVSPAWCELQYWYSLTKYGKIKRTPAMKQGSRVHRDLEAQVHDFVPIEVETREDAFGLRIWNVIQGLRTLRTTGLTRELEIWGVLDGEVINGVIDELSYICPDPDFEKALEASKEDPAAARPPNRLSIKDFFAQSSSSSSNLAPANSSPTAKIYLTDIKTRTTNTLPQGAALKTVRLQLQLYHHLLRALARSAVPREAIFTRYQLSSAAPLSASVAAALTALECASAPAFSTPSAPPASASPPAPPRTLTALWDAMQDEFAATPPPSAVLRASFRAQADGAPLGSRVFAADDEALARYVAEALRWWRGERAARGVDVEDAFKCRACAFAEGCEWRVGKVREAVRRSRVRWGRAGE